MFSLRQINRRTLCDKMLVINKNLSYVSLEFKRRIHTHLYIYLYTITRSHTLSTNNGLLNQAAYERS